MLLKWLNGHLRQHGVAVLVSLPLPNGDFAAAEVQILDPQPQRFKLINGHDNGQSFWPTGAHNAFDPV